MTSGTVVQWLDVEVSEVHSRKMDLVCRLSDTSILHIEFQSRNDPDMALRMAEYMLAVYRQYREFPKQVVLYVGHAGLNMPPLLAGRKFSFEFDILDVRDLDGEMLMASADVGDNVLAVLARLSDPEASLRQLVRRIAGLPSGDRSAAVAELMILANLRGLAKLVEQEITNVPILEDIMEHNVIGPEIRKREALGEARGEAMGKTKLLRRQIARLFGPVPAWADKRLAAKSQSEIEELGLRIFDVKTLEELFQ